MPTTPNLTCTVSLLCAQAKGAASFGYPTAPRTHSAKRLNHDNSDRAALIPGPSPTDWGGTNFRPFAVAKPPYLRRGSGVIAGSWADLLARALVLCMYST